MAPTAQTNATTRTRPGVTKPNTFPRRAYVTFLAGAGDYWKGVVGLAKGLRKTQSPYPLVVALLPDVPLHHRNKLLSQGCIIREIDPVDPPQNQTDQFAMAHYIINYSKLRIWEFVEYSKMIYLDGDIQVFENIDHLFDLPDGNFYAVMDCFCEKSWSGTPQHQIGYCQLSPKKFQWPEEELGPKPPPYFNAGMFVFEPNLSTYDHLLHNAKVATGTRFAEQDLLNVLFRDVYKAIPNEYNFTLLMLWRHPENVELEKVKVVHYTCASEVKPWRVSGKDEIMDRKEVKMLVDKWWDIYDDRNVSKTSSSVVSMRRNPRYPAASKAA